MLRPDLSATAEIVADTRVGVVAVPIIALIVRPTQCRPGRRGGRRAAPADSADPEALNVGVFVVRGGTVRFTKVELGIAGQEYFEALLGVQVGDPVVAGPYQAIRDLRNGDAVRSDARAPGAKPRDRDATRERTPCVMGGLLAGLAMNVGQRARTRARHAVRDGADAGASGLLVWGVL